MTLELDLSRQWARQLLRLGEAQHLHLEVLPNRLNSLTELVVLGCTTSHRRKPRPDGDTVELGTGGDDDAGNETLWGGAVGRVGEGEERVEGFADGGEHGVEPHVVDKFAVLFAGELDGPFAAVFIIFVFPGGDDVVLAGVSASRVCGKDRGHTHLE